MADAPITIKPKPTGTPAAPGGMNTTALVASLAALLGGGGAAFSSWREKGREGETKNERTARIVRNGAVGAALGGGAGAAAVQGVDMLRNSGVRDEGTDTYNRTMRSIFGSPWLAGGALTTAGGAAGANYGKGVALRASQPAQTALDNARKMTETHSASIKPAGKNAIKAAERWEATLRKLTFDQTNAEKALAQVLAGKGNVSKAIRYGGGIGAVGGAAIATGPALLEYAQQSQLDPTAALPLGAGAVAATALAKKHPIWAALSALTGAGASGYMGYNKANAIAKP